MYYCFDANFGLVLKKAASKSKKAASRSQNMFVSDEQIGSFVKEYDDGCKEKKVLRE